VRYYSPLRYPGGKAKLADYVKLLLRENDLLDGHYLEVYAGGASVGLELLLEDWVSRISINDIDRAVHGFWRAVLDETDALCQLIRDQPVTATEWQRQRSIYASPTASPLELGFAAFFLNRTNRSGIIASGGMIGGNAQTGRWKLDARYNKQELIHRIERIARYRGRISLTNLDAQRLLAEVLPRLPKKSLVYLDPPYYVKGRRRLYANFYEHGDHAAIAKQMARAKRPWIVSYDAAPEICRLYSRFRSVRYGLGYTARDRYEGEEVMFFSDTLKIPEASP